MPKEKAQSEHLAWDIQWWSGKNVSQEDGDNFSNQGGRGDRQKKCFNVDKLLGMCQAMEEMKESESWE